MTWGLYRSQPDEANTINGIGSISGFVVQTARAQNVLDVFTIGSGISNTGGMFTFGVDRYGVDAADTLANDAAFCGLHLRRLT